MGDFAREILKTGKGRVKMLKKIQCSCKVNMFLAICFAVCMLKVVTTEAAIVEPELTYSENATPFYYHDYLIWSDTVCMNLAKNDSGYLRVEHMDNKILLEQYSNDFQVISKKYLADELPLFGGFYAGRYNYYIVYAQNNLTEDDSKEVMRIVQYDQNWNRIASASLCGENIYMPLDAGSLRMAEYNGYLYIRTCRECYMTKDGFHHQTNLSLQIRTVDMSFVPNEYTETDLLTGLSYNYHCSAWDTSHSFNQFISIDDAGNIVTLDHGDANPRDAGLNIFNQKAGTDTFAMDPWQETHVSMMRFGGSDEKNLTRAAIGGLTWSSENYLVVGTSIDQQTGDWNNTRIRNAFIAVVPRDNPDNTKVGIRWLTAYSEEGNCSASNPYIIKMENDTFLVMWEEMAGHAEYHQVYQSGNMSYVFLDKTGTPISQVYTVKCCLSDCEPIVVDGSAVWYESSREGVRFRQIDSQGNFSTKNVLTLEGDITVKVTDISGGFVTLKWNKIQGATGYYIKRRIVKSDSYIVRTIMVDDPEKTECTDHISYYTTGDICEYIVYAHNDKIWSKASNIKYITLTGLNDYFSNISKNSLKNGKNYTVDGLIYKYKKGKMTLVGKSKKYDRNVIKIPATVLVKGKKYPVTAISKNAFANDSRITQVTIGKNISSIGKNAFSNCKYLWKITINSQKLKSKTVGKNAFKKPGGSFAKTVYIRLPKKKYKVYKKILKSNGIKSKDVTVKFSKK